MPSKPYAHRIFCLEGEWSSNLKHFTSVEHMLRLLESAYTRRMPYIHRDVGTREEMKYYLNKWSRGQSHYRLYNILYLAFHGQKESLLIGGRYERPTQATRISLDELEDQLAGRCNGRVIHFGTCGTVDTSRERLLRFCHRTRTLAVMGYKKDIEWIPSAAFDLLLFDLLEEMTLSLKNLRALEMKLRLMHARFMKELGFTIVTR